MPFYGVAMYDYVHRTVVSGAEPTIFWEPIMEQLQHTAPDLPTPLRSVYTTPQGNLDLTPHVELWMIHDLGHACHAHHDYWFPLKWLMELFASLCLYTYIAKQEPDLLPVAEIFFLVFHDLPPTLVAALRAQPYGRRVRCRTYSASAERRSRYGQASWCFSGPIHR